MSTSTFTFKAVKQTMAVFISLACAASAAQSAQQPAAVPSTVEGVGATFPSKVYAQWAKAFEQEAGIPVHYKPTGSGDGLKQIKAKTVSFSGSDSPLPPEELAKYNLVQVPMLVGGVVPVVNLPGVADKSLLLSGEVLAAIMSGKVLQWNHPTIAALNPGLPLPATPIHRVVRLDKSGTTDGFTRYLATVSEAFKNEVGVSQKPKWPGNVQEAEGNDGVVAALKERAGSITYVSFDRARKDALNTVRLLNASGKAVAASEFGFRNAFAESAVTTRDDDQASIMNQPGPHSWPIALTSFVLVPAAPENGAEAARVLKFLYWCFMHGDKVLQGTGFAPLPTTMQARVVARLTAVKPKDAVRPQYVLN